VAAEELTADNAKLAAQFSQGISQKFIIRFIGKSVTFIQIS
jgi:hypothetical protein